MEADLLPDIDTDELPSLMEPLVFSEGSRFRSRLMDQVLELVQRSAALRHSLPPAIVAPLSALVRSMNCYYSNLIEGTIPIPSTLSGRSDRTTAATNGSATSNSKPSHT